MNIIRGKQAGAKKICVYGPEGIGKSTFASRFPEPLFIDTEGSTKDMDVARFESATSWAMLLSQVQYVLNNPGCCRTLVIDTADWAEQIEVESLCDEKGWSGLEDPGYGKGYTYSAERFGKFLNMLQELVERGIHVVMTAHAQLRKVELPEEMGAYDHWEMKTSKKVAPMIREWADAVFFANYKTVVVEVNKKKKAQGGQRVMYTCHTPFWDAKNRYDLPEELPFDYAAIQPIIERTPVSDTGASGRKVQRQEAQRQEASAVQDPQPAEEKVPQPVQQKENQVPSGKEAAEKDKAWADGFGPDQRINKKLRDLMVADNVCEFDLQNVVEARLPGAFPPDMPVADYPEDFINEWVLPNWKQIVEFAGKIREKEEIPF